MEPKTLKDEFGEVKWREFIPTAKPFTCSSKEKLRWSVYAGYEKWESDYNPTDCGLLYVDHCVGKCRLGQNDSSGKMVKK